MGRAIFNADFKHACETPKNFILYFLILPSLSGEKSAKTLLFRLMLKSHSQRLVSPTFPHGGALPSVPTVQPQNYVPFLNRVSGTGGFMFRVW